MSELGNVSINTSTLAVTTGSQQAVPVRSDRRYLGFQNTGAADITLSSVSPAVAGAGIVLAGAGAGKQGGSWSWDGEVVPNNAFWAIGGGASVLTIVEG